MTFASAEAPAAPLCDLRASRPGQGTGAAIASERSPPRSPGAPLFSHFCAPARLPRTLAPDARGVPGANSAARLGAVVEACQLRRPVRRSIARRIAGAQAATARRLRSAGRRDFAGRRSADRVVRTQRTVCRRLGPRGAWNGAPRGTWPEMPMPSGSQGNAEGDCRTHIRGGAHDLAAGAGSSADRNPVLRYSGGRTGHDRGTVLPADALDGGDQNVTSDTSSGPSATISGRPLNSLSCPFT